MSGNWKSGLFLLHTMKYDLGTNSYTLTLTDKEYERWHRAVKREQTDEENLRIVLGDLLARRYVTDSQVTEENIENYLKEGEK
jgi:hypothetical protein